ncbi:unnamed protein product [Phytophthora fragariaefolia]|uniref:Unnamed protein product n=1 Tax=Phytophthora fragariaefolia TaxID=1490495 RepID=A0A9W7CYD4_9STRA|nr:unnamed protein product [Phytophthora fragariaefolia]
MGFHHENPVQVWCDSKSAISIVKNPGNHKATKHAQVRYLFTRDLVEEGRLDIHYCPTDDMASNIQTKAILVGVLSPRQ